MNIKSPLFGALLYVGIASTSAFASDTSALTETQKADLVYMYQEEKVARDVYRALGEQWSSRTFANIQKSEQKHMDAIRNLLEAYDIPVPVIDDSEGVFDNEELQSLYDELIEQGGNSLTEALGVGVLVEETDIADLESRMVDAPQDVVKVFSKLLRASNNHLRAFNRVLERSNDDVTETTKQKSQQSTKGRKQRKRGHKHHKRGAKHRH